ncbi:MAG TPA: hypothetical protein VFX18_02755 [Candidatus Nitrosocosmicus sp.]|jgi:hypothetical protein|nr:hypothetical protein [Candidatus Nitrosocosmicus sp.]
MSQRKPILLIDDSINSQRIRKIFQENQIEYIEYHIKKFGESCCGELPTTKAPSVIAVEGIFKEDKIEEYINNLKKKKNEKNQLNKFNWKSEGDESAYW